MSFEDDYKKGLYSEILVINYFKKKGWIINDLRNDWFWRKKDCDIQIQKDNYSFLFEIKQQKRIERKNEIVIELYDWNRNTDGWFYYSKADYFVFVNPIDKKGYVISAFNLKEYIENNNFEEELNSYSNCEVYYLNLNKMKNIYRIIDLRGCESEL